LVTNIQEWSNHTINTKMVVIMKEVKKTTAPLQMAQKHKMTVIKVIQRPVAKEDPKMTMPVEISNANIAIKHTCLIPPFIHI